MTGRKRPKSVRKARALAIARQEQTYSSAPHSFIFNRPPVGNLVKQLTLDIRKIFEPFTATQLKTHRKNVLKDFITVAGPLHVTHMLYLTHPHPGKREAKRLKYANKKMIGSDQDKLSSDPNETQDSSMTSLCSKRAQGGVYMHLIRVPRGPSLTFAVVNYSLQRDVITLVRRTFDSHQFTTPPLLAMTGFGSLYPDLDKPKQSTAPPPHLRLIVDMFQNMLPSLNLHTLKLGSVRRVLLISREVDTSSAADTNNPDDVIYIRHYRVRTENRTISRALRRLRLGGSRSKKRTQGEARQDEVVHHGLGPGGSGKSSGVPNLAKYTCMEDFLTKTSMLSDSGLSDALSDLEEVELPSGGAVSTVALGEEKAKGTQRRKFRPAHGLYHLGTARTATVRLTEIGPRLTLRLLKIEEGLNTGTVLYHRWQSRSLTEVSLQAERLRQREALRAARRAEHEARRAANLAAREAHRAACLEGMKKAGHLPSAATVDAIPTKDTPLKRPKEVALADDDQPAIVKRKRKTVSAS